MARAVVIAPPQMMPILALPRGEVLEDPVKSAIAPGSNSIVVIPAVDPTTKTVARPVPIFRVAHGPADGGCQIVRVVLAFGRHFVASGGDHMSTIAHQSRAERTCHLKGGACHIHS